MCLLGVFGTVRGPTEWMSEMVAGQVGRRGAYVGTEDLSNIVTAVRSRFLRIC